MKIGLPKETRPGETRIALTPLTAQKLIKKGFSLCLERTGGVLAGFPDQDYQDVGVELSDAQAAWACELVVKVNRPSLSELAHLKKGALLIACMDPYLQDGLLDQVALAGVNAMAVELIPRTSRAQAMDVLSSQANIAGYRAVLEAASQYGRFFPMMMTAAGSAKPAKVMVLGAGVAGLQAIATAKRLGAVVEAYDVRAAVKEQILSLGAKFLELDLQEEGSGQGGYAKELSAEAKARQQKLLTERLQKMDVIISTANIPGKKAPVLITEAAVQGMRPGSVVVDMAAASGGNCPLSVPDQVVVRHQVKIVGFTQYPALLPADASQFYGQNILALLGLLVSDGVLRLDLQDDIIAAATVVYEGQNRWKALGK